MNPNRNIKNTPTGERLFSGKASSVGAKAVSGRVDKDTRTIHGFAVATLGEAETHDQWVDEVFLNQMVSFGATAKNGFKARFGHPGMSTDNVGRTLGRVTNLSLDGNVVRGDMVVLKAAKPEYANHVLQIADEAPDLVGTSIAFHRDLKAEEEFQAANLVERTPEELSELHEAYRVARRDPKDAPKYKFKSPDPKNVHNYPHVRLKTLNAVDFVDTPAANPSGFFGKNEDDILAKGESLCAYVFGETDEFDAAEVEEFLGVHPERIRRFVEAHLDAHKLQIVPVAAPEDSRSVVNPAISPAGNLSKGVTSMTKQEMLKKLKEEHGEDYEGLAPALTLLGVDLKNTAGAVGTVQNLLNDSAKAKQLEAEALETKAKARVDKLIAEFRVQPAHREVWMGQARLLDDAQWAALSATLNPVKGTTSPKAPGAQLSTGPQGTPAGQSEEVYDLGDTKEDKEAYTERMKALVNSKAKNGNNGAGTPMPPVELQNRQ